jgi:hypothetical protein
VLRLPSSLGVQFRVLAELIGTRHMAIASEAHKWLL